MNLGLGAILDFVLTWFELDLTWYLFDLIWFDIDDGAPKSKVEDFIKNWIRRRFG